MSIPTLNDAPGLSRRSAPTARDLTVRTVGVRAGTIDESARTVRSVMSTEGQVLVLDMRTYRPILEVLRTDGAKLPGQVVLLDNHRDYGNEYVIGSARSLAVEDRETVGTLHFADGDERADSIWNKVRQGHITDVSVGYRVLKWVDLEPGTTLEVAGDTYKAPAQRKLRVVTEWELHELSVTPIGADDAAKLRAALVAAGGDRGQGDVSDRPPRSANPADAVNESLRKFLEQECGLAPSAEPGTVESFRAGIRKDLAERAARIESGAEIYPPAADAKDGDESGNRSRAGEDEGPPAPADAAEAVKAALAAQRSRDKSLRELAFGDGITEVRSRELYEQALDEDWDEKRMAAEALTEVRRGYAPAIHGVTGGTRGDADLQTKALGAALCRTAGVAGKQLEGDYGSDAIDLAESGKYRGASLHRYMHAVCRAAGMHLEAGGLDEDGIRTFLDAYRKLDDSGRGARNMGVSTVSLPQTLSNVQHKTMLAAFVRTDDPIPMIARESGVSDFKEVTRIRLNGVGRFEEVGPDGVIKQTELGEEAFGNRAKTYARGLTLTREMMINNDLGSFAELPRLMGRMARLARLRVFFGEFLDNAAFFSASGKSPNLLGAGAGSALSIDGLTAADALLSDMPGPDGDPYGIDPAYLLVPTALKVTARELYDETKINQDTASKKPAGNPHAGKFEVISSPYLNNSKVSGGSATAWYLLADPADVAAIEVVYLNNRRVPFIDRAVVDPDVLGMKWRGYFDFGVRKQDPRAVVKSPGA